MNMKYYQKQYECMPLDELKKLQGERLAKNFRHVYENVEYYRKRCQEDGVQQSIVDFKSCMKVIWR